LLSQSQTAAFARQHCSNLLGLEFLRNVQLSAAAGMPSSMASAIGSGSPHTPPISSSDYKLHHGHNSHHQLNRETGFSHLQLAAQHAQNAASKMSLSGGDPMKEGDEKFNTKLAR
jgi:hypothetical protein